MCQREDAAVRLSENLLAAASHWSRTRKSELIAGHMRRLSGESVLLVGVTSGGSASDNLVERAAMEAAGWAVLSGLAEERPCDARLANAVYVRCDGRALPFRSAAFDVVVSNAVIEHVGDEKDQRLFAAEHHRVGSSWAITTPNRRFPIEPHTRVLFRHWFASWREREVAHGSSTFTRLLTRSELRDVLPTPAVIRGTELSPTLTAIGPTGLV